MLLTTYIGKESQKMVRNFKRHSHTVCIIFASDESKGLNFVNLFQRDQSSLAKDFLFISLLLQQLWQSETETRDRWKRQEYPSWW